MLTAFATSAPAQELEPRAYSASPIGTNFAAVGYSHLRGDVGTDAALPVSDVNAKIDVYAQAYARTFALLGRTASVGVVVPFTRTEVSGEVIDDASEVSRAGIGDTRLRLAVSLIGGPAMTPEEFARRTPEPTLGTSLVVVAPTGQYESSRVINVGANRWAVKPEVGFSYPIGDWFVEGSAGVWLYGDNNDFARGRRREQDPLAVLQFHGGYNFRPGWWIAFDAAYIEGGRTIVNREKNEDVQHNGRYGLTMSVPLSRGWSTKAAWSKGFATRFGGDYTAFAVALQYTWFDRR